MSAQARLGIGVGLLHAHRAQGTAHPLLRALGPLDADSHVLDGTLGLALDALHVAAVTGARVTGFEWHPALFSLTEAGLRQLAASGKAAASRVQPFLGDSRVELRDYRADAVMLSPMFDEPRRAPPGFELLRHLARHAPLGEDWLASALSAAPRVVLRARRAQPVPPFAEPHLIEVMRGKAVDYWVFGPT